MSLHDSATASSVVDLIGGTPLLRLRSVEARAGTGAEIWAKAEYDNPGGSVKDRAARQIILDAIADGRLGPGRAGIERPPGGQTGIERPPGGQTGIERPPGGQTGIERPPGGQTGIERPPGGQTGIERPHGGQTGIERPPGGQTGIERPPGGRTLIDSTSGNTGVAYSMIGAALGIPITLVMPANVSVARKHITQAYGTTLMFSSELEGSDGAIRMVQEVAASDPAKWFYPDQYANPSNWRAHFLGTGAEIIEQTAGRVTHFVAGVGTTGTVMGCGRRLKQHAEAIRVYAVQPDDAWHGLEGMKHLPSSIVPPIWQPEGVIDDTIWMPTEDGWDVAERLVRDEGLFVGHSAGANVAAALRVARQCGPGDVVVTILCDRGDRYFEPMKWEKQYVW